MAKSKANKTNKIKMNAANILLIVQSGSDYYAAGPAWKLPTELNDDLNNYEQRGDMPILVATRAFVILLDKAKIRPEEWIAENLTPPKLRPGRKRKR